MYSYAKAVYGFFFIWYSITMMVPEERKEYISFINDSANGFNKMFNFKYFDIVTEYSPDILTLICAMYMLGGFFCLFGFSASIHFIMISLLLDLTFIHNTIFFTKQRAKINVLKTISFLGGAYFII